MSLLAVVYHLVPEAPILVACNRDEMFDRPCPAPSIQSGKPRVLASIDPNSNGTYLGINQNGMFVGAIRRKKYDSPSNPRSRGALCRELLRCTSARQAVDPGGADAARGEARVRWLDDEIRTLLHGRGVREAASCHQRIVRHGAQLGVRLDVRLFGRTSTAGDGHRDDRGASGGQGQPLNGRRVSHPRHRDLPLRRDRGRARRRGAGTQHP